MTKPKTIEPLSFQENLIWWDGLFKALTSQTIYNENLGQQCNLSVNNLLNNYMMEDTHLL